MIHVGDCLEVMRTLDANSVDAIVTDPPYGLGFMGKAWDHTVPGVQFWSEMLRVAKPGAYLAAFGGTRTHHRLMCAIEDAGWELRDVVMWVYGSGFPKSKNIGGGYGTALKPAWEPIVLARKPLAEANVAANFARWGVGAMNIDGCRVETADDLNGGAYAAGGRQSVSHSLRRGGGMNAIGATAGEFVQPSGRWPANLIHDGSDDVLAAFPNAPGQLAPESFTAPSTKTRNAYGERGRRPGGFGNVGADKGSPIPCGPIYGDTGNAARFFYCAKADRADRADGCEGLPLRPSGMVSETSGQHITRRDGGAPAPAQNNHPTVKPTDLMRWLCRLVAPPGGLILDPFTGSGSTGRGAVLEGFRFAGIELSKDYAAIAEARIAAAVEQRRIDTAQIDMFVGEVA